MKVKAEFDRVFARPNNRCSAGAVQAIYKPREPESESSPICETSDDSPGQPPRNVALGQRATEARLGLVIAKRFLPLAVERNRVKRLIREAFRLVKADLPPLDIIVRLARKPESEVSAGDLAALFGKMQRSETKQPYR